MDRRWSGRLRIFDLFLTSEFGCVAAGASEVVEAALSVGRGLAEKGVNFVEDLVVGGADGS
jgi:hypothetical protein